MIDNTDAQARPCLCCSHAAKSGFLATRLVQTVCKGYPQKTKSFPASKELIHNHQDIYNNYCI